MNSRVMVRKNIVEEYFQVLLENFDNLFGPFLLVLFFNQLWKVFVVIGLAVVLYANYTEAGQHKKKKITIHVPIHKKIEKHTHTVIKHIHHHHKPIVLKEEKKIIEEHHPVIKNEHVSHEHHHHHEAKHEHDHKHKHKHIEPVKEYEDEEDHIHHHHSYEHKTREYEEHKGNDEDIDDDFIERH